MLLFLDMLNHLCFLVFVLKVYGFYSFILLLIESKSLSKLTQNFRISCHIYLAQYDVIIFKLSQNHMFITF